MGLTEYTRSHRPRRADGPGCGSTEPDAILAFMEESLNSLVGEHPSASIEQSGRQLEALLEVSEMIAQQRDLKALFHELSERLHRILQFDFLALILYDATRNTMRLHILEMHERPEEKPIQEMPVETSPSGWVWQNQKPFVSLDTS